VADASICSRRAVSNRVLRLDRRGHLAAVLFGEMAQPYPAHPPRRKPQGPFPGPPPTIAFLATDKRQMYCGARFDLLRKRIFVGQADSRACHTSLRPTRRGLAQSSRVCRSARALRAPALPGASRRSRARELRSAAATDRAVGRRSLHLHASRRSRAR
jgi:hypothetical protein